ncbi:MAG: hypothetical protein DI539_08540 [Flavobacterium psychrophilum]|nr:MAG: hypothetical protein DI539_08540 [Flavobacterium psychrophilum]
MKLIYFFITLIALSANAQTETLNWDDARINGKMELTISKRDFEAIYKKADKIVTPDYTEICGSDEDSKFQYYYHKNLQFELDNGIMNFMKMTFSKKDTFFFSYKDRKFDGNTTLNDLKTLFPEAVINTEKDSAEATFLLGSGTPLDDNLWRFTLKNGILISIEYFSQC